MKPLGILMCECMSIGRMLKFKLQNSLSFFSNLQQATSKNGSEEKIVTLSLLWLYIDGSWKRKVYNEAIFMDVEELKLTQS